MIVLINGMRLNDCLIFVNPVLEADELLHSFFVGKVNGHSRPRDMSTHADIDGILNNNYI